jgi:ATP-dependent 26S proteasome regulatory subunit
MMTVEEKPDVTYEQIGGLKEQIERLKEVVELPLLYPERFVKLGIDPPKGVLLYGPPGTVNISVVFIHHLELIHIHKAYACVYVLLG